MGTYYTQTRARQLPYQVGILSDRVGRDDPTSIMIGDIYSPVTLPPGQSISQTTTSFRTGGSAGNESLTNDQILLGARDEARRSIFPYDNGHVFDSEDFSMTQPSGQNYWDLQGWGNFRWRGNLSCCSHIQTYPFYSLPLGDLTFLGAQAINATVPTKPSISTAELLAQLKSGQELPGLTSGFRPFLNANWFANAESLKEAIGNFLHFGGEALINLDFGWLPFVNDIQDVASMVVKSKKTIAQFVADDGKPVRRKYRFPEIVSTQILDNFEDLNDVQNKGQTVLNYFGGPYDPTGAWGPCTGKVTTVQSTKTDRWFSGEYMYHLPDKNSLTGRFAYYADEAQKLLGSDHSHSPLGPCSMVLVGGLVRRFQYRYF